MLADMDIKFLGGVGEKRAALLASELGIKTLRGTVASGDRFVASAAEKERITSLFGAVSCEMEGGAVGHVCYVNGTPFAVIRAISDDADKGACEDYPAFAAESAKKSAAIVLKLAERLLKKAGSEPEGKI